jgi:hypothetical protein
VEPVVAERAMRSGATIVVLLLGLLWHGAAQAHAKSTSYSSWTIAANKVQLAFTVPTLESARIAAPGAEQPTNEVLASYLKDRLRVSAAGKACPLQGVPQPLAATEQFRRFEFHFTCPGESAIELQTQAFFELVPSHVTLAQIETADGTFTEQLFTKDSPSYAIGSKDNVMRDAGLLQYIGMGINHILTGVDHMSFLVGLVLISRRLRDLVFVVTGFTLGHSATLALAVTGTLRPHAEYIDALVALTIALIGAENIAVATHRPGVVAGGVGALLLAMAAASFLGVGSLPPLLLLGAGIFSANYLMISGHLRDAARLRLVVTLVFGLIHGFGFAADLLEMKLPTEKLVAILFGFNLGVEVGQLTLVLTLMGVVALLVRRRLALSRPVVVDTAAASLVALGTYWFISRSFVG